MPIYEYSCECGALLETIESVGTRRERCAELCTRASGAASAATVAMACAAACAPGEGRVERVLSAPGIRGDGKEARAATFDPVKRAARPGCDDCSSMGDG